MKKAVHIVRILIGLLFVFSGFVKAVDPWGFQFKLEDYFIAFNWDFFMPFALFLAILVPAAEFIIGFALLLNLKPKYAIWGALIFMAFFLPLTLYLAITDAVSDCGCFGEAIKLSNWNTFYKNIIITTAIIFVIWQRKYLKSWLKNAVEWILIAVSGLFIIGVSVYGLTYLPIVDFLPYKIGVDLKPDPNLKDKYFVIYKNKTTGQLEEYPANQYPWDDSLWMAEHEFVDTRVEKAAKSALLILTYDNDGNDVTDSVLLSKKPTMLIVSYDIKKVNPKTATKLKEWINIANKFNVNTFLITSSDENLVKKQLKNSQIDIPYVFADDIALKMLIRANPGIVMMRDGVIKAKYTLNHKANEKKFDKLLR
jgi:uncharacterized membrane protein YphA (DoxX/SURF4 family)